MLDRLPFELVRFILSYFTSRELARLAPTCRMVNAAAYDIFLGTLSHYGVPSLGGAGYANYRESIQLERVQVQSTFPFMDRMQELRRLLEMFEQQIDSMVPMPTQFIPRAMLEDGEGIEEWRAPSSRLYWVYQERIGSRCPELRIGIVVSNPGEIAALVDCATMVQCLLALINGLDRADLLRGFDHDTRAPRDP